MLYMYVKFSIANFGKIWKNSQYHGTEAQSIYIPQVLGASCPHADNNELRVSCSHRLYLPSWEREGEPGHIHCGHLAVSASGGGYNPDALCRHRPVGLVEQLPEAQELPPGGAGPSSGYPYLLHPARALQLHWHCTLKAGT